MRGTSRRHAERGQVLPLWIFGAITTLTLMFLAINYANSVRYQIRAQTAADSAAQALVGLQAQRFNEMNIMLATSNVEEFRLRKTLDGMLLAINATGGCQTTYTGVAPFYISYDTSEGTCNRAYQDLRHEYLQSVNRYSIDVTLLNDVTATISESQWQADAANLLLQIKRGSTNCGGSTASVVSASTGDCDLSYHINGIKNRANLLSVQEDAARVLVPALGTTSSVANDNENQQTWAPGEVDVSTCVAVPPLIPNFGPIHLPTTYAIGRAAAADVMMEQDWMQLGSIIDPQRGSSPGYPFQQYEPYTQSSTVDGGGVAQTDQVATGYDWYGTNFGGNTTYAFPTQNAFAIPGLTSDELSILTGWWNAIPERPFASLVTQATACS